MIDQIEKQNDLLALLGLHERDLILHLDKARAKFSNSTNKGGVLESAVRNFLDEWTPLKLKLACGEIIDSFGHKSKQVDGLIINLDQPFWQGEDTPGTYLIEGVESVFEVKSKLGTRDLTDILDKATAVEKLVIAHGMNDQLMHPYGPTRFTDHPPVWAIAFEKGLLPKTVMQTLLKSDGALDAIFVLGQGVFINLREGNGPVQVRDGEGNLKTGWHFEADEAVLSTMIRWLNSVMQMINRAGPVMKSYFRFN